MIFTAYNFSSTEKQTEVLVKHLKIKLTLLNLIKPHCLENKIHYAPTTAARVAMRYRMKPLTAPPVGKILS